MSKSPFLQSVRTEIRTKQYSYRTEKSYLYWVRQFILFNDKKHPKVMGNHEIERFLNHLAVNRGVSPGTQNQALCAIIFVYKHVLKREIENLQYKMTKTPRRMPTVLSPDEVASILQNMDAEYWLITALLYGCGLRINEALSLRVKDIDLKSRSLLVFNGKGRKDRYTLIPGNLREKIERQFAHVRTVHESDLADGFGLTSALTSLHKKYGPIMKGESGRLPRFTSAMKSSFGLPGAGSNDFSSLVIRTHPRRRRKRAMLQHSAHVVITRPNSVITVGGERPDKTARNRESPRGPSPGLRCRGQRRLKLVSTLRTKMPGFVVESCQVPETEKVSVMA